MKKFAAYQSDGSEFSWDGRDTSQGILGKLVTNTSPIAEADTLEDLMPQALTYLGQEPEAMLYLTDLDNHVREIVINKKHHDHTERLRNHIFVLVALLMFCLTGLLASATSPFNAWIVLSVVGISILYLAVVRFQVLNRIESAVICEAILILGWLMAVALLRKWDIPIPIGG